MNKKFTLREFPLDEIDMLNKITSQFKNWDYINIEQEDLVQECLIKLLEDWEKWENIRNTATSSTLMYVALRNYSIKVWNKEVKKQLPYDKETLDNIITRAMKQQTGIIYDVYEEDLSPIQKEYIAQSYSEGQVLLKKEIKEQLKMTQSEMIIAEEKIKTAARFQIKSETRGIL